MNITVASSTTWASYITGYILHFKCIKHRNDNALTVCVGENPTQYKFKTITNIQGSLLIYPIAKLLKSSGVKHNDILEYNQVNF